MPQNGSCIFKTLQQGTLCVRVEVAFVQEFLEALQQGFSGLFAAWYLHRWLLDLYTGNVFSFSFWGFFSFGSEKWQ